MSNQIYTKKESNRHMAWTKYAGGGLAIAMLVSVIAFYFTRYNQLSTENLRDFISSFGMWAPLAYGIVYIELV